MENILSLSNPNFWLILGVILIVSELAVIQGMGLLFAGIAGITVGSLIIFNIIDAANNLQIIVYFLAATILWAMILWKPLKKLINKNSANRYNDIVNTEATIDDESGLKKGKTGNVKWSGTRMRAKIIEASSSDFIEYKQQVFVHNKIDGVLLVDTKKPE